MQLRIAILLQSFCHRHLNERGANLVEYALLVTLIALVCVAAVAEFGANTREPFSSISAGL
jgi:Flp pilus assembly pilin Flp